MPTSLVQQHNTHTINIFLKNCERRFNRVVCFISVYDDSWMTVQKFEECMQECVGASYCTSIINNLRWSLCGEVSARRALHTATVTHGCHCPSYQKKILESRLAEADGLSFPSFRKASIPLETETGAWLLSLEPLRGGLDKP